VNAPPRTPVPTRRPEILVAGLVVLAAALYFAIAAVGSYAAQWQARHRFEPVQATVVSARVVQRGGDRTSHGTTYRPAVVYRYAHGGRSYTSDRFFFTGQGWPDEAAAAATVGRYLPGAVVEAYVDTADPQRAVLDRSAPGIGMLAVPLLFAAAGVALAVYGWRGRRAQ
jgi:hypothetical protein